MHCLGKVGQPLEVSGTAMVFSLKQLKQNIYMYELIALETVFLFPKALKIKSPKILSVKFKNN